MKEENTVKSLKGDAREVSVDLLFSLPILTVLLDLDLEKLTEFAYEIWKKDKDGVKKTNIGGWQSSDDINKEKHEEIEKLKKEITCYLQMYHSEVFRGMEFKEKNIIYEIKSMWVNMNETHHYNEWHTHPNSTLSGAYYIKHDGSKKNGELVFKHPNSDYLRHNASHWPVEIVEKHNVITASMMHQRPESNMLIIFPSWLEHKVEANLKNDSRISVSFNSSIISLNDTTGRTW